MAANYKQRNIKNFYRAIKETKQRHKQSEYLPKMKTVS